MNKGNIRLYIESLIEDEYRQDRMQYSGSERMYHPHYDGKNGYRAQAMEEILNMLVEKGVLS